MFSTSGYLCNVLEVKITKGKKKMLLLLIFFCCIILYKRKCFLFVMCKFVFCTKTTKTHIGSSFKENITILTYYEYLV